MKAVGKFWTGRSHLDSKLGFAQACHCGMILSLILVIVVYLPYYFVKWSSDDSTMCSFWTARWGAASDSNQSDFEKSGSDVSMVQYKMEWESPDLIDATENERIAEDSFGEAPRRFVPLGTGSFLFVLFGAYRTGPNSFGVTGLGSKPLHATTNPGFECSWIGSPLQPSEANFSSEPTSSNVEVIDREVINGTASKYTEDDLGYRDSLEYVAVVVHCTFESPVGINGRGGELKVIANHGESATFTGLQSVEFVAMVEQPGAYNKAHFDSPFRHEYMYCGSPLHGSISPHRLREWIAYHMRLFGQSSHFMFYDTGGMNNELWKVLEPWAKLGRVSIMNVKQQARYRAYFYNQFLLANDCMLRSKTLAKWTFFFDLDEYLHVTAGAHLESSFHEVMSEMAARGRRATTLQLEQRAMSSDHCVRNDLDPTLHLRQWAFEKLPYLRDVNKTEGWLHWDHWQDSKSAYQAKYLLAVGVHYARHVEVPEGMNEEDTITRLDVQGCGNCYANKLHYYHYHGTTAKVPEDEVCKVFVFPENITIETDGAIYEFDNSMCHLADIVRESEYGAIGPVSLN